MNTFITSPTYRQDIAQVLVTPFPWSQLEGKHLLITGATGLLGSFLVDVLMQNPQKAYEVWICGRNESRAHERFSSYWADPSFHFFEQDMQDALQSDTDFHVIFHCAGDSFPKAFSTNPVGTIKGITYGTDHLLDYGRKHGLERFIYISTGEVYGDGNGILWKEEDSGYVDCTNQRACYPTAKRLAENLCIAYSAQFGLHVTIARPSHIYGATFTESDNRAYAQFLRNVLASGDIVLKSTGIQQRSYCYVADCVAALLTLLFHGENGKAYNIADNNSFISIRQLAELIAQTNGRQVICEIPSDQEKSGYSILASTHLSTERMESLGWTAKTPVTEGVKRIMKILKNQ